MLAASGYGDVAAFEMPSETIRKLVQQDRASGPSRLAEMEPDHAIDQLCRRGVALADKEMERIESHARQTKLNVTEFAKLLASVESLSKLAKANRPAPTAKKNGALEALAKQLDG